MPDENTKLTLTAGAPHEEQHKETLLLIVGPTGVGKTAVAIEVCKLLGGEIISADSMQLYRGLDIGTAKATPDEQARARHHLIDILRPDEEYSAARWAQDARLAIAEIRARGKRPIIVGGTGFYLTALLFPQRLASAPPDAALRAKLQEYAEREGSARLHQRLQNLDAAAAARLHPNDTRRVIRAIEVATTFSRSDSQSESTPPASELENDNPKSDFDFEAFGLSLPREVLYKRLNDRVDAMLRAGFMDELRAAIDAGFGETIPLQNLGYRHMRPALDDGTHFDAGVELWKRDTRRYAKRQMTWFRHQLPVRWMDVMNRSAGQVATEIVARFEESSPALF
jgi:tRNA dimethylallyltransferase